MTKYKKILGWVLAITILLLAIYTLFWAGVVITTRDSLNKSYAGKSLPLSEQATLKFEKAFATGFPFNFAIQLQGFVEENNTVTIRHQAPLEIGYNILTQNFYTTYNGESIARYKPEDSGFGSKVVGEFKTSIYIPLNSTLFKVLLLKREPFEIINHINDLIITSNNVKVYDLVDNSVSIGDAKMRLQIGVKHHQYYTSFEELLHSIPKDYSVKLRAESSSAAKEFKSIVPMSLVYWAYIPADFIYSFDVDIHTGAKEFNIDQLIKNDFIIKTNQLSFSNNLQSTVAELYAGRKIEGEKDNIEVDYSNKIKLTADFSQHLGKIVSSWANSIESTSSLIAYKPMIQGMNFHNLHLNTGDESIKIDLQAEAELSTSKEVTVDLKNFAVDFGTSGVHLKATVKNNLNTDWLNGVIEILEAEKIINFFVKSYFAVQDINHYNPMGEDFWCKLFLDFAESIADNINPEASSMAIKLELLKDIDRSKVGRYTYAENYLLYYNKLFRHLLAASKSPEEAMQQFRIMIPANINEPKIFEKVTQVD